MFWALNGATRTPSWRRMRHSAAVSTDLPALDEVPCTMRAGVGRLRDVRGLRGASMAAQGLQKPAVVFLVAHGHPEVALVKAREIGTVPYGETLFEKLGPQGWSIEGFRGPC